MSRGKREGEKKGGWARVVGFGGGGGLKGSNLFKVKSKIIEQYVLDLQHMKL